MRRCILLLGLAACSRAAPPQSSPVEEKVTPTAPAVMAPPDAAPPVVIDAPPAGPTPGLGMHVRVEQRARKAQFECTPTDLTFSLVDASKKIVGTSVIEGVCAGVCDKQARADGQRALREAQKAVDKGETSSVLDYNFTECIALNPGDASTKKNIAGRDVVVAQTTYMGPHDEPWHALSLTTEICGQLWTSDAFGDNGPFAWTVDKVTVAGDARQLHVIGHGEKAAGPIFTVELPACPGKPVTSATERSPHD